MKILVSGLCLSRNLGGAAMALTLIDELDLRLGSKNEYLFCVSGVDFDSEREWAKKYNLKVVPRGELEAYITHFTLWRYIVRIFRGKNFKYLKSAFRFWQNCFEEHTVAIKSADIVINMEGVSYIGDGTRDMWEGINSYSTYFLCKLYNKPYLRFIQSFGPFANRLDVRFFAKSELKNIPIVFARGEQSAKDCRELLGESARVYDFPDCAILLPKATSEWTQSILKEHNLKSGEFVVLSPSSVVYSLKKERGVVSQDLYIEYFKKLTKYFIHRDYKVLFLPHMYSTNLSQCDREIAKKVLLGFDNRAQIIERDINPKEAKAIIKASKFAIVSRYHALVAALSTMTPVIAIGWNIKYYDLMRYYNLEEYALDCRGVELDWLYNTTIKKYESYKEIEYEKLNEDASLKVDFAFNLLKSEMIKSLQK